MKPQVWEETVIIKSKAKTLSVKTEKATTIGNKLTCMLP